jgi:hypothetical protein
VDAKQTALLTDLHAQVAAGNFRETDVQSIISLLREESPKHGPIRELGDFAAHRLRDYGPVHTYIKNVKTILDRVGTQRDLLNVKEVFSEGEIAIAFDVAFADHGLPSLSTQRHRQLQLAIISLLQGVRFKDKKGKEFGRLSVTISRLRIELDGLMTLKTSGLVVRFPVLTVANDCFPMHSERSLLMPKGSMLKVVVREGVAILEGVKPYEIHVGRRRERGRAETAPIEWVEVESALTDVPVHALNSDQAEFSVLGMDGLPVVFNPTSRIRPRF